MRFVPASLLALVRLSLLAPTPMPDALPRRPLWRCAPPRQVLQRYVPGLQSGDQAEVTLRKLHPRAGLSRGLLDMEQEVQWMSPDSLYAWNNNGIYDAFMIKFAAGEGKTPMGGYFGVQIRGKSSKSNMLLFSLWDKHPGEAHWQAVIPRHTNCKRNCNDCAVHSGPNKAPDGSTGTKCSVDIPKLPANSTFRLRIRRVAVASSGNPRDLLER